MMTNKIKQLSADAAEEQKFIKFIEDNDDTFDIKLSSVVNLKAYTQKLIDNAVILYSTNNKGEPNGVLCGYANDERSKKAYVSLLVVEKKSQGKGIAGDLLAEFEQICLKSGYICIDLAVNIGNNAASFYEKKGFSPLFRKEKQVFYRKNIK